MIKPGNRLSFRVCASLLAFSGALLAPAAVDAAEVYKCTGPSGKVEFTDAPCGTKQTSAVVEARPNSLDNSALREQLLKIENKDLQDRLAATRASPVAPHQSRTDLASNDSSACRTAKRDVEAAATSIENNKALIRARQSAMYVSCGVREPDQQTTNVIVGNRRGVAGRPYVDPRVSTR